MPPNFSYIQQLQKNCQISKHGHDFSVRSWTQLGSTKEATKRPYLEIWTSICNGGSIGDLSTIYPEI